MKMFIFANEKRTDKKTADILQSTFPHADLLVTKNFNRLYHEMDSSYDVFVCAGGDGTLNSFLNIAIAEGLKDKVYGVIPLGSGNDFSKYALGSKDVQDSIDSIVSYSQTGENVDEFDIGYISPKETIYFHNVAGLGFDAKTVEEAPHYKGISKRHCYRIAAGISMVPYWLNSPSMMDIRYGDNVVKINTLMTTLNNTTHAGSGIPLNPEGSPVDGIIDLLALEKGSLANFAKLFLGISKGDITVLEDEHVHKFFNKSYEISSEKALPLQYDGELHPIHVQGFRAGFAFKMKFIYNNDII